LGEDVMRDLKLRLCCLPLAVRPCAKAEEDYLPEHSIGLMHARPAMWFGLMLLLLPSLCWSSGVLMAEGKIRKKFPRTHPDPAFLCTETEKSSLHPDKYYIIKSVYEGIDLDNNTVRDVPKPTDGDDLIMLKEETDEKSVEARFNKKTLYHKHTLIYKVPVPNTKLPPFTRTIDGPCEALPDDGDGFEWPASVMQYEVCVAAGGPSNCNPGRRRICTPEMNVQGLCPP
jgi:hypothetical protein